MFKRITAIVFMSLMSLTAMAKDYQAGFDYLVLDNPIKSNSEKVVVNEFFGYTCPHCNNFEPMLHKWAQQFVKPSADASEEELSAYVDDVTFVAVPVVFGRSWEPYAKSYYIARQLGILDQTHQAMYNAVHVEKRNISTKAAMQKFFAQHGVSEAEFDKAYDSFNLKNMLRQGNRLAAKAKITGVPMMLVNGKYVVNTTTAGSYKAMLEIVDHLVAQERATK